MRSPECDCSDNGYHSVLHCANFSPCDLLPSTQRENYFHNPLGWHHDCFDQWPMAELRSHQFQAWPVKAMTHLHMAPWNISSSHLALYLIAICRRPKLHGEATCTECTVQLTACVDSQPSEHATMDVWPAQLSDDCGPSWNSVCFTPVSTDAWFEPLSFRDAH